MAQERRGQMGRVGASEREELQRSSRPSRLAPQIEFINGNLHLPELNLWLDPHEPQVERVFVSHAHSDHIALHREIILSAPTAKLMRARLDGNWREHVMNFGEARRFENGGTAFELKLLPAGHIFSSSMALVTI